MANIKFRILLFFLVLGAPGWSQQTSPAGTQPGKLAFLIPDLIPQVAAGQLGSAAQPIAQAIGSNLSFGSGNSAIAVALSNLPVPSSASAVRYRTDERLGVPVPFAQSLGPILTERAETLGRDRFFFAVSYQRFQFDRQDDLDERHIHTGFALSIPPGLLPALPAGGSGLITTDAYYSLNINQSTAYFTYGLTNWLDATYAVPLITTTLDLRVRASLTAPASGVTLALLPQSSFHGSSTGLGDQTVRLKAQFLNRRRANMAFATEFRLPTGDEFDYHGAGAFGIKPFLIASFTARSISPHVNAGYQWNGSSFLASRDAMQKRPLPRQAFVAAGADAAVTSRMTASIDLIDQIVINGERNFLREYVDPANTYRRLAFQNDTRHEISASAGFKARLLRRPAKEPVGRDLVITANAQFRLNNAGLRARIVPLVGLSYIFGGNTAP